MASEQRAGTTICAKRGQFWQQACREADWVALVNIMGRCLHRLALTGRVPCFDWRGGLAGLHCLACSCRCPGGQHRHHDVSRCRDGGDLSDRLWQNPGHIGWHDQHRSHWPLEIQTAVMAQRHQRTSASGQTDAHAFPGAGKQRRVQQVDPSTSLFQRGNQHDLFRATDGQHQIAAGCKAAQGLHCHGAAIDKGLKFGLAALRIKPTTAPGRQQQASYRHGDGAPSEILTSPIVARGSIGLATAAGQRPAR